VKIFKTTPVVFFFIKPQLPARGITPVPFRYDTDPASGTIIVRINQANVRMRDLLYPPVTAGNRAILTPEWL